MPASYPAADLPEVTITLQQTLGTTTKDIATLTIRNWNLPLEDGAYHFGFAYTGENVVSMNADDGTLSIEPAPGNENAQPQRQRTNAKTPLTVSSHVVPSSLLRFYLIL